MVRDYNPGSVEAKWQKRWEKAKVYEVDLKKAKRPFYAHVMFPYPSGDKLHVGHWYNFGPADSYARYQRMKGCDVLSPMGFDAFGLPAENYAIKTGIHPSTSIAENVKTMTKQLKRIGCMYDWSKSVNTSTPEYYRWTQWLFAEMFKHGLAFRKEGNVNFCPGCQTVLANEQVWEGACERCETEVFQKPLTQWYWKITKYAQRLLDGLDDLDWPEKTRAVQRNWIGRKEGINITYEVAGTKRGTIGWGGALRGMNSAQREEGQIANPGLKPGATIDAGMQNASSGGFDGGMQNASSGGFDGGMQNASSGMAGAPMVAGGFSRRLGDPPSPTAGIHSRRTVHITLTPKHRNMTFNSPALATLVLRTLDEVATHHTITIHEACTMPDHVHLLISFDRARDLQKDIVKKLKGASARTFRNRTRRMVQWKTQGLWSEGIHHKNVDSDDQFHSTIHYIQENPAKVRIDPAGRILSELPLTITCFTTRPDTNFGATFIVLAPDHPFAKKVASGEWFSENRKAVQEYIKAAENKTERERQEEGKKKTGVFTGYAAVNNLNSKKLPIWIGDFVLSSVGTGAVIGVPGHDVRDFEFAKTFDLPIVRVVVASDGDSSPIERIDQVQEAEGTMINSQFLNGLHIAKATENIKDHLELMGWGERVVTWRLRDWSIGRQRYWGTLIPIVYDPEGKPHALPKEHLPWLLPTDVEFKPTGKSPIGESKELKERTEKIFGKGWTPEADTMDTFVCSSFYSLRYLAEGNEKELVPKAIEKKWMPVQMYIGGAEHSCMHLIYARFVGMALKDFGHITHEEQYRKLVHQGVITNKGAKMSKSKGNVVSPDAFIEHYGSDVFRMYLMFMGPYTEGGDWSDTGIKGAARFANRVHAFFTDEKAVSGGRGTESSGITSLLHKTIKKVTDDIENLHFNTALSALMIFLNEAEKEGSVTREVALTFTKILAPLAPHLAEELWEALGQEGFVIEANWPSYDESKIASDTFTLVVQVNGKVRANIVVPSNISKEDAIAQARGHENVQKYLGGKEPKKEVYVEGKLVSLVA